MPAWVLPLVLMLVAGSAFALLRGNDNPALGTFASTHLSAGTQASGATRQAREARGTSAVLPAPQGWSPGQQK